jgi:hypothetical protein
MGNGGNTHQRGRNSRIFEEHTCGRGSSSVRKGKAWRFFNVERDWGLPFEPHYRVTSRATALDAKHMRSVRRPLVATHVKDV